MNYTQTLVTVKLLLLLVGISAANAYEITLESLNLGKIKESEKTILEKFTYHSDDSGRMDKNGWSILVPSRDSRIIFVSSSIGDDQSGKIYSREEIKDLNEPGKIAEYKTIHAALKHIRPGYPDYLLLKRGDRWKIEKSIVLKGGRSPTERMVFMSYGRAQQRPVINSTTTAIKIFGTASNIAISGVYFYAYNRNPESNEFSGWESVPKSQGIRAYAIKGTEAGAILIEDCVINFFSSGITLSGGARFQDIVVRRNYLLNSYSQKSHSQGFFALNSSILLEENLFDHNGWYQLSKGRGKKKKYGQATIYNHNTYFANSNNSIMKNNVFLRASSAQNKWSTKSKDVIDSIHSKNLAIRNNFYYEGEIGISAGGNTDRDTGPRWSNISLIDNVMLGMGKNQPTNRTLGWYITIDDWNTGIVCGNHLLDNQNKNVTSLLGISVTGHSSDIVISHNTISGLITNRSGRGAISTSRGPVKDLSIAFNSIDLHDSRMQAITIESNMNIKLSNNTYFTGAPVSKWFKLGKKSLGFDDWKSTVSDQNSRVDDAGNSRLTNDFKTYLTSLGISSIDEFVIKASKINRNNRPANFGSSSINDYFRRQFGNLKCPLGI